jgi:hypothetical protein
VQGCNAFIYSAEAANCEGDINSDAVADPLKGGRQRKGWGEEGLPRGHPFAVMYSVEGGQGWNTSRAKCCVLVTLVQI